MREDICTIPINDVFIPRDGCPMCRLQTMLENNYVEYITGAAMMEPSVRVETNETGFCHEHFQQMITSGKRLPNALLLETHLEKLSKELVPANVKGKPDKKSIQALESLQTRCFVCDKIKWGMAHMMETIFNSWENDEAFRKLYSEQPYICLPHYTMLIKAASNKGVSSKRLPDFYKATAQLAGGYLESLKADISHFSTMFDYRSEGQEWGTSIDSIERSVAFLTGRSVQAKGEEEI
ncbi:MAG TPA: hypothetical protein GX401_06195 [Clostridiales bacterium]|nr:hypothetical protein [Clostridiales bacterium]